VAATKVNPEIYFNPKNDPATWPHMSEYMIGLGVSGTLNQTDNTGCTSTDPAGADACNLRKGVKNSSGSIGWTTPNGRGSGIAENIDDTWHAALAGRGQFFSAANPQDLVDQLSKVLSGIQARAAQPAISAVNASVLTTGALSYNTGYDSTDWSGVLQAVTLNEDGSPGSLIWDAGTLLTNATQTNPGSRAILTAKMDTTTGKVTGMAFRSNAAFDAQELAGLMTPASAGDDDTLANRVDYIRGVRTQENAGVMRGRRSLLGAIIGSQALYVSYPSSGYTGGWPVGSPEAADGAQTYDEFVSAHADRPGTLYVGANDGMLHAFDSSLKCNATDVDGNCTSFGPDQNASAGTERWAYVPRAVYGNLGNLTSKDKFQFAPTVDGTPVSRDVFFDGEWHTILVGGLRLGGRGIYALDITDPTGVTEASAAGKVLWEFDADAPAVTGVGNPADLGYTYGQPNIGRLANGKWVVVVPTGYYPDCSKTDRPANCQTLAAASNKYSALFVLDAKTGAMIAELKTPTDISGVSSHGLASPVLGDYNNDQIDDVAFAGDLDGNLWRFDLSSSTPANWTVTLAYQGIAVNGKQGVQPITVMPRLFPDPATNRFMVVFGTGKYLGADDNTSDSAAIQSLYGIRDRLDGDGNPVTVTNDTLQVQTLTETVVTDPDDDNYGATLRSLTNNNVASDKGGWKIDLQTLDSSGKSTDAGERMVVTAGAIFSTNTAVISKLIPGSDDLSNPTVLGSAMFIDATTGGAGTGGVSSLGGFPYVGARVNNVRTSGSVPVTTTVGGGKAVLPGVTLTGKKKNNDQSISGDAPIWRRRSWTEVNYGQ
jgi:type IV pilus assembly protein PilY1